MYANFLKSDKNGGEKTICGNCTTMWLSFNFRMGFSLL